MKTLVRSQLSAFTATVVDLLTTVLLVELFHVWPGPATVGGNVAGAGTNFLINRVWTFRSTTQRMHHQALRYALVWCGYVALNFGAMVLGTEVLGGSYVVVKVLSAVILGLGYNYVLHKHFVYA
ncbi:MAG TPA: GtrA family protein [Flavobacteriales bacterium]|jgi:putative flippase GtrA|nr:GtrA family protein [Flavobacteriales bacterium]